MGMVGSDGLPLEEDFSGAGGVLRCGFPAGERGWGS